LAFAASRRVSALQPGVQLFVDQTIRIGGGGPEPRAGSGLSRFQVAGQGPGPREAPPTFPLQKDPRPHQGDGHQNPLNSTVVSRHGGVNVVPATPRYGQQIERRRQLSMNVIVARRTRHYRTVWFDARKNAVRLIEQRLLPHRFEIIATPDFRATSRAIREMIVRGAGAIGATAAYGLAQGARAFRGRNREKFSRHVEAVFQTLKAARPTAVDPVNAMTEVRQTLSAGAAVEEQQALALAAAEEFANRNVRHCEAIGQHGAPLIREGMRILTHCNAGWLAFVDMGTATAPLYAAQAQRKKFHVFCNETRPRSQGATLTAWELAQQNISHEIIAD